MDTLSPPRRTLRRWVVDYVDNHGDLQSETFWVADGDDVELAVRDQLLGVYPPCRIVKVVGWDAITLADGRSMTRDEFERERREAA